MVGMICRLLHETSQFFSLSYLIPSLGLYRCVCKRICRYAESIVSVTNVGNILKGKGMVNESTTKHES